MTQHRFTRLECDRCGATEEIDEDSSPGLGWARVTVNHDWHAKAPVGDPELVDFMDLCRECRAALRTWVSVGL